MNKTEGMLRESEKYVYGFLAADVNKLLFRAAQSTLAARVHTLQRGTAVC